MPQITVDAQRRDTRGKNTNRRLRKAGRIPAVMYGPGKEPVAVCISPVAVKEILYSDSGRNTIFTVSIDGSAGANVMVKDYQLDPVKGDLIHADLFEIAMDRLLELTIPIEIVGEAEGVKL